MTKKALIFGITGMDGRYLTELLLSKGYSVSGVYRRASTNNKARLKDLIDKITLIEGDITDQTFVFSLLRQNKYDEIYNLAAQSHVATSFKQPNLTFAVNALGPNYILEAIRLESPNTKFYQASTSEMFGKNFNTDSQGNKYQDESTALMPQSPYAIAKLSAHHTVRIYRESFNIFACSGILFNHESPYRGENFVTRKITKYLGGYVRWCCRNGVDPDSENEYPKLKLGNLDAYRDWGHAEDYCKAIYLMMQQEEPDDFVICTGAAHTVRHFLHSSFKIAGIHDPLSHVEIDRELFRPAEVDYLRGDSSKAKKNLGWEPKYSFDDLVLHMVVTDLKCEKALDW